MKINIIGGGLAGCEASYQLAKRGINVTLYEAKPKVFTEVHKDNNLAELVCSNSFKSLKQGTAGALLKEELKILDSLLIKVAYENKVPAGDALVVDRVTFAKKITDILEEHPKITIKRSEATEIPKDGLTIIATGPLTTNSFSNFLINYLGEKNLFFFDAISPILEFESINLEKVFFASRYQEGNEDYINCPFTKEQYYKFIDELIRAEKVTPKDFEKNKIFQACQPIEDIANTGIDSLSFGPMKPVGLIDPKTGKRPFAVLQLRAENTQKAMYNMVGFQTRLKYPEQERIFRMISGLENAKLLRFGSVHKNIFINSPTLLNSDLSLKKNPNLFFAGQITGVEGYVPSIAMGMIAALSVKQRIDKKKLFLPSNSTMIGALMNYLITSNKNFQPMNPNFGLLPSLEIKIRNRKKRYLEYYNRGVSDILCWRDSYLTYKRSSTVHRPQSTAVDS